MIPKFHECMQPALELFLKNDQTRRTITEQLAAEFKLTEPEKNETFTSGTGIFATRVNWAITYLTKAEYVEPTEKRGLYRITSLGKENLQKAKVENKNIDRKWLDENSPNYLKNWKVAEAKDQSQQCERNSQNRKTESNSADSPPEEDETVNLEMEIDRYEKSFDDELLEKIRALPWQKFEDICAELMEKWAMASRQQEKPEPEMVA